MVHRITFVLPLLPWAGVAFHVVVVSVGQQIYIPHAHLWQETVGGVSNRKTQSLGSKMLRRSFLEEIGLGMVTTYTVKARVQCACPELTHAQKRPEGTLGLCLW